MIAFEPSIFNLELLARNLHLNSLQEKVILLPLALSDEMGSNFYFRMTLRSGEHYRHLVKMLDGMDKTSRKSFLFPTYGLSMDQAVDILNLPVPDFIKMDVDGIEHFLLQGGTQVLKKIQGILLEINDDFVEQADMSKELLEKAGLKFIDRRHSEMSEGTKFKNLYNQIWVRKMITALLIGRKGSRGFPGKNITPVLGKPMAWYPMKTAKSTSQIDQTYLSTDDPALMEIANSLDVEVIERPDYLADDQALGEDAYLHGYQEILKRIGEKPELIVLLFCNAATISVKAIVKGIEILRENQSLIQQ